MKLIKLALAASALTLTAPIAMAHNHGGDAAHEMPAEQTMVTAKVKGMVCDFCARAVTKVFGKNDAVENVHVDLDTQEIHVTLRTGGELSDDTVGELVKKSGYTLVSVTRETA
ncbi:MAG: heavy-metal-associated domain-containing protein [Henriciella sp.]|jgi:copper chaperone CopZ